MVSSLSGLFLPRVPMRIVLCSQLIVKMYWWEIITSCKLVIASIKIRMHDITVKTLGKFQYVPTWRTSLFWTMLISYKLIAEGRFLRVNKGSLITIKRNKVNTLYILQGIYCLDLIDLPVQWKAMKNKGFKKESERWTHISKDIWQKETPRQRWENMRKRSPWLWYFPRFTQY